MTAGTGPARPRGRVAAQVDGVLGQGEHRVRLDWGPTGAAATAAEVSVVVDVLSFSTSVTVAVERGMQVLPFAWRDARAAAYAEEHDAVLAVGRLEATRDGAVHAPSLSPAGLLECAPVARLVLPSPNGSSISAALAGAGGEVVVGCLRNASAVARHLAPALQQGRSVSLVAAGERWQQDDSLRPSLEDHLGVGAVLSAFLQRGLAHLMSPEATAAAHLFEATRPRLAEVLEGCAGGRELTAKGFAADVRVAAQLDVSVVVPRLVGAAFTAAGDGAQA